MKGKKSVLVSIIVPVYNIEDYIEECLNSIIDQSYENIEIILVDDGSVDKSSDICDRYSSKDKRIKVIHKKNGGLSDARNRGIKESSGEYLSFVDGDDYLDKDFIKMLLELLLKNNADISVCEYFKYDGINIKKKTKNTGSNTFNNIEAIKDIFAPSSICEVMTWNKLYKKKLFIDNDISFPEGKIHEDNFTTYKLFYYSQKITYSNKPLYYYRQRLNSIMSSQDIRLDAIEASLETEKFIKQENIPLLNELEAYQLTLLINIFNKIIDLDKINPKTWKKVYSWISKRNMKLLRNSTISVRHKALVVILLLGIHPYKILRKSFTLKSINSKTVLINLILLFLKYKILIHRAINKPIIFILGTPLHNNIGDQAITLAEHKFIKNIHLSTIKIPLLILQKSNYKILNNINSNDIILGHGGGNMGDEYIDEENCRRTFIEALPDNKIIIFPQTIYFSDSSIGNRELNITQNIYNRHKNLTIIFREEYSWKQASNYFPYNKIFLTPDIVLSMNESYAHKKRNGVLLCFRGDQETRLKDSSKYKIFRILEKQFNNIKYTDMISFKSFYLIRSQKKIVKDKIKEFKKTKLVVTDRLHGMVFAAITGTPCIAFSNYNHKVKSTYKWIEKLPYIKFANNISDFKNSLNELDLDKQYFYDSSVFKKEWSKINSLFEKKNNG